MSQHIETEAILKKAKEQKRKHKWLEAAKFYEQALPTKPGAAVAEIWQEIGFCCNHASRQAEDIEEFKKVRQRAVEAYKNAARLFGKEDDLKSQGKSAQCEALAEYIGSWLALNPEEKKRLLDECRTLGHKALEAYKNSGDKLNYGTTCNDLQLCLLERLYLASDAQEKQIINQEGIDCGNRAISVLSQFENKNQQLLAYSIASLQNWYAANISEQEERRKKFAQRSLSYSEKAQALSKGVEHPYHIAISRWAAALSTLFFTEKVESALEHAREMSRQGVIAEDNFLRGVASYLLAHVTDWMVPKETIVDKKRERYKEIVKFAEEAVHYLQLVCQDTIIAETYSWGAESYSSLAGIEVDIEERRALLEKAIEIGRRGLEHAVRSGSPDARGSILHSLSKALQFYSNLEPRNGKKAKLLEEALIHRQDYIKIVERTFPSNDWVLGVGKYYAALIKAELARMETEESRKIAYLEDVVLVMQDGVSHCAKWVSSRPAPSLIVFVAGFEDSFGAVLNELYLLTEDEEILTKAIEVYNDAAEKFRKVDLPSRVAESHWKLARTQECLGEYQKAAQNFQNASAEYKIVAQRFPYFIDFYLDYAAYMEAWSEIERAKFAHGRQEYATAMKHYDKSANLLEQSELWNYLSSNFRAWSLLEHAEDLSRKESDVKSIEAFRKATETFREAKRTIQAAVDGIENVDEKDLAKKLITVSDTRGKYCLGRVAVEEAKILDKQGDHTSSSIKYESAAEMFEKIAGSYKSGQTYRELQPLIYLCRAWQKMMMAEVKASPEIYGEAAKLFTQAKEHTLDQSTSLLALANSSFCKALEAGTEFEVTRDTTMFTAAKKYMSAAANYYLKAGFELASEYTKATQRLFDAYAYMDNAKKETDPEKEARYYVMAEKVLQTSAASYIKAKHDHASQEVQRLLEKVREERELAVSLGKVLHAPTIASSTTSFITPTPVEEMAVGLERFEHADVHAKLIQHEKEIRVGEDLNLEMQIANVGKEAVLLARVEEIPPAGFQLVATPDYCDLEDAYIDMKGKRLGPLETEEIELVLRALDKGTFQIRPRIVCVEENGNQMLRGPEPVTIDVSELVLPGRITTGFEDLDNVLFGGIPENYAVILTAPSCDERDLLIKKFLEAGVKQGQITFYITIEASGVATFVEEFQSNFYVLICNPRADTMIKSLPNVFKLTDVENLTNINIALTRAFRGLNETQKAPRRVCVEIISDILLQHQAVTTRRWLTELIPDLRSRNFTTLAVMNPLMHSAQEVQAILGLFEGEINIYEKQTKKGPEKFLRINKMYNQKYSSSELLLRKERLGS